MSASDPGLRRVAVHAGTATVDLVLPATLPVAALIPSIIDMLGDRSTDPTARRYQLSRLGQSPLPHSTTLAQNGIRDGGVLVLSDSVSKPPIPPCDDVTEAVSAKLDSGTQRRSRRAIQLTGALAAGGFITIGALVLIRNAFCFTACSGATAGVAAAAGCLTLLGASIARRAYQDRIAGLTLSLIAAAFAAIAGLLAVPGAPGVPHVLLAAMAVAVTSVLAMGVTGCGIVTLTAVACGASTVAVAALVGVLTALPPQAIGSLGTLASVAALEASPRMSIRLAGLSPRVDAEMLPTADRLAAKALRADDWLTSLHAGFAGLAAIGAIVAALAAPRALAVAAVTAAVLVLRSRSTDRRRTLVFAISGIVTTTTTFAVAATSAPERGPWIAAVTATLAAVAVYLGFVAPTISLSPVARRSVETLECLALVTLVPLTCWICGAFSAVRGLDLV